MRDCWLTKREAAQLIRDTNEMDVHEIGDLFIGTILTLRAGQEVDVQITDEEAEEILEEAYAEYQPDKL